MELKDNPGFLLHKIGAMMERSSDLILESEFGIGYSQFKILFTLEHHPAIHQKEIAHFLGQTEASISRQIKLLRADGLITVAKAREDKKKHVITASTKGKRIASEAFVLLNARYQPILADLTATEQQKLASSLSSVHDRLEIMCSILADSSDNEVRP